MGPRARTRRRGATCARVGGFDAVVNLAGAGIGDHRWSPSYKGRILRSRVEATSLLVAVLNELPESVHVLASASALGYYGSRGAENIDERSLGGDGFLAQVCEAWESAASRLDDGAVAFLRTGAVVGRHGGFLAKELPLFRLGLGGRFGRGDQWMSPISLLDEVRAILWILDRRLGGPVNLVGPTPITNRDFARELARALRRPARTSSTHRRARRGPRSRDGARVDPRESTRDARSAARLWLPL